MAVNFKIVIKYGAQFGIKNCSAEFGHNELVGFVTSKWNGLYSHNITMSYTVPDYGEGMLSDDDDVSFMLSLVKDLSLERVEVVVKLREGVVVNSGGNLFLCNNAPALEYGVPDVSRRDITVTTTTTNPLLSTFWAGLITDVGQVFKGGAKEFRMALCKYAIEIGFEFHYVKNERVRVTAECKYKVIKDCKWRIHASIEKANGFFYIRKFSKKHTCGCSFGTASKRRLTCDIIAQLIMTDIRAKPDTIPNDIVKQTKTRYGVDISYFVAWRAVEAGRRHLFGDHSTSYSFLDAYFREAARTNLGSVFDLEHDVATMKFRRCFFAFAGCLSGFKGCRPIVCVDGTFLKGKHRGILLSAISKDGDEGSFPLAFAVVSEENDSNWEYFFKHLKVSIGTDRVLTFLSDRQHGIIEGVKKIFPDCAHSYCIVHLQRNLKHRFKGSSTSFREIIETQFNRCAYAATKDEFDNHMAIFRTTGGTKVSNFLSDLPYANWACAHFIGNRYGEMTSNLAESWNSQISKYRGLPITEMIDAIRSLLMLQMCLRKDIAAAWYTELCPAADERLDALVQESRTWIARKASDSIYEVLSDPVAVVDIHNRSCSCRLWQIEGFPCAHAVCVLFPSDGADGYGQVDDCFTVESYRLCYSQPIYPFCKPVADTPLPVIGPPEHQPRRGRPKTKRIPSRGESIPRRMKCSRCGQVGNHNKKTCSQPV